MKLFFEILNCHLLAFSASIFTQCHHVSVGKGTISKRIAKDFRMKHVSSGDLLRAEIAAKSGKFL